MNTSQKLLIVTVILLPIVWIVAKNTNGGFIPTMSKVEPKVEISLATPTASPNCPNDPKAFGGLSKSDILQKAIKAGADVNNLKEIAATFDLVCEGTTDIDTSKSADKTVIQDNSSDNEISKNCQQDREKYNSCLTEYSAKMTEYQSCLSCKANKEFGCDLACVKPYSSCSQYKPGLLCN